MDRIWGWVEGSLTFAGKHATLLAALVGLGFCRACHGWTLGYGRVSFLLNGLPVDPHLVTDLGELAGFFILALIVRHRGPLARRSAPWLVAGTSVAFSIALVALHPLLGPVGQTAFWLGSLMGGFGYASLFLLWLELCGCIEPRCAILVVAGSYAVSLLSWVVLDATPASLGAALALGLCATSMLLLVAAYRRIPAEHLPRVHRSKSIVSWRIIVWVALLSLAFGFGDGFTNLGFSTLPSKLGMVIPIGIIALGMGLLPQKFDMGVVYRSTLPLMVCGMTITVLLNAWPLLSQAMMSAAQANYLVLACAIVCMASFQSKSSSVFSCGLLLGVSTLCAQAGKNLGAQAVVWGTETLACFIAVLACVVVGSLLLKEQDFSSLIQNSREQTDREKRMNALACEHGLSNREQTVFMLLAQGESTSDIGDELFIAQSTVRAHISRIYEKFEVHTRAELDERLNELAGGL